MQSQPPDMPTRRSSHASQRSGLGEVLQPRGAPRARREVDRSGVLHDAAYDQLRSALMDGQLKPGQTFTIRAVASVFGTSPMPVRDALKRLVAERALEMLPNRSVVLPVMTRSCFQEILQVRLALEPALAAKATPGVTPAVVEAMEEDHGAMCAAASAARAADYLSANRRFHFRLYEAARTTVVLPMVETLWMRIGPHLNQIFGARQQAVDAADHHHMDLLRALRRQDAQGAARAIWDDLSDAADAILAADEFDE